MEEEHILWNIPLPPFKGGEELFCTNIRNFLRKCGIFTMFVKMKSNCHSDDRREEDELLRARPKNLVYMHVDVPEILRFALDDITGVSTNILFTKKRRL